MSRRTRFLTVASLVLICSAQIGRAVAKTDKTSSTVDNLLKKIAAYEEGKSRENLIQLADIVRKSHGSSKPLKKLEKQCLKFLRSDVTPDGKKFICRQLAVIGSEDSVTTLAAMLTKPEVAEMARYALERIPSPAADKALLAALDKTSGKTKIEIIHSLGQRRSESAARPLGRLLKDTDKEVRRASAAALGRIGNHTATSEVRYAYHRSSGDWHRIFADAYLACAYNLAASGNKNGAADVYRELYNTDEPLEVRSAALIGLVDAAPEDALRLILNAIKGETADMEIQPTAISLIRNIPGKDATKAVADQMPNLSADGQVQLLAALADRKDPAALPAVINAAKSKDQTVRLAAMEAMVPLGDASTAVLLAETAAATKGIERYTARNRLCSLNAPGADQKIIDKIFSAEPKLKVELIRAVGCRNIADAMQNLFETVQHSDRDVRMESIQVLKNLAEPQHMPILVDILKNSKDAAEVREAEKMVSAVARKSPDKDTAAKIVLKALVPAEDIDVRCALLRTLGDLGGTEALAVLRKSLKDDNIEVQAAAVRALSDWPDAAPIEDLLKVTKTTNNRIQRALALRGYVRLITLDRKSSAKAKVKMFKQAMKLVKNNDERKMILSALTEVKSPESLQMAVEYMDNRDLNQEAAAAVIKIAEGTIKSSPKETKAALEQAVNTTKNDSLKQQALELLKQIK